MKCPICNEEPPLNKDGLNVCYDNDGHFFRFNNKGYFRFIKNGIIVGHGVDGYYADIFSSMDYTTRITVSPFVSEDSLKVLERYKALKAFI